jgi:tetratricopeptide (TPR) repeat protein
MRFYREAIGIDSSFAQAYNNLGIVYQKMGRDDDAIKAFTDCITADPAFYEAYYNRGNARYDTRDYAGSLIDYSTATGHYQPVSAIHFSKGASFFGLYKYDSAAHNFELALSANPENIETHINLGTVCLFQKKFEDAKSMGKKALFLDSASADAMNLLGMVYMNQGDYQISMEYFNDGLRISPDNSYLLNNKGFAQLMTGEYDQALANINESISINHENPWAYRNKGIWYLKTGDFDSAIRLFQQSINMDHQLPYAHYYLGLAYLEKAQLPHACEAFSISSGLKETEGEEAFRKYCK